MLGTKVCVRKMGSEKIQHQDSVISRIAWQWYLQASDKEIKKSFIPEMV